MTIEIPEPPDAAACATCMSAITWVWHQRSERWMSIVVDPVDRTRLRLDVCRELRNPGHMPNWRDPVRTSAPDSPARAAARAAARGEQVELP